MFKAAYVTSSRADYGIVRNYLKLLHADKNVKLDVIVTGAILDKVYGEGYHIIEEDEFNIIKKIDLKLNNTNNEDIINSMSIALKEFGEFFAKNKYDLVIILGDRYEMLSVAAAAAMNKLKILHIHGGEITLGNYDEFIRHSITKMSHFHFTSTEEYKKRVIQLGEAPDRVFYIGAMGAENCKKIDLSNVNIDILNLEKKRYFVVLFHPETLTISKAEEQIETLLKVILKYIKNYKFIFLGSNADTGSNEIRKKINEFMQINNNIVYFENVHPDAYHYLLKNSIALIGNSSSGIIEAPTLGCYTVNIGDRQQGRIRGESILDVKCTDLEIQQAINKVLNLPQIHEFNNPYYKENASKNAYNITLKLLKEEQNSIKDFFDMV